MILKKGRSFIIIIAIIILSVFVISSSDIAYASETEPLKKDLVLFTEISGVVGISMENYIAKVLEKAKTEKFKLVVFQLDTPGGLVSSMRGITSTILDSKVPVVVWVAPRGSRAASAGAFIVQSASVAAMASGTNIGAAHPVQASGGDVPAEEMEKKITNDLAAQMRSLTEIHGRNGEVCGKMVTESISLTSSEALEQDVIDILESDLNNLLDRINGREVIAADKKLKLQLSNYSIQNMEMTPREKVLHFISSPSVAYILLMVGIYAIIFEVLSPGGFVMGVSGAVMVLLGAYGLRMLPFNWAGIIFLVTGIVVMVLDLVVGGIGILSLFGMASLIVGSLIVFRAPGGELLNVSMDVIIGVTVGISLFFIIIIGVVLRSLRVKASSGPEGLIGTGAKVIEDLSPMGMVTCHGEIWKARSISGETISKDTETLVVDAEGLTLLVQVRTDLEEEIGKEDVSE